MLSSLKSRYVDREGLIRDLSSPSSIRSIFADLIIRASAMLPFWHTSLGLQLFALARVQLDAEFVELALESTSCITPHSARLPGKQPASETAQLTHE
jgi:hypothetical protein